jgi:polyisoprenoid-binding protein YceI
MKLMIRFSWLTLIFAALVHRAAANEIFKFDPSHSTIGFRVHQFVITTAGKFRQFSGKIEIDRAQPERSSVLARIQVSSIDTGIKKRDDHLRSAEFFNVAKYPEITFQGRSVRQTGLQSGDIFGDLTMHGVTRPITLHVKLLTSLKDVDAKSATRWVVTTAPLKRREFGLMFSSGTEAISGIGQDVAINIEVEAVKTH